MIGRGSAWGGPTLMCQDLVVCCKNLVRGPAANLIGKRRQIGISIQTAGLTDCPTIHPELLRVDRGKQPQLTNMPIVKKLDPKGGSFAFPDCNAS